MTAADDAYKAAEAAIAEAGRTGADTLRLNGEAFRNLETLPPEISGLTGLQIISLNSTQVSDLAPLAGLTGLKVLLFNSTQVSDLAPLAGLTKLGRLELCDTQVSDLAPLAKLTELQVLLLHDTRVSDLAPLAGLTRLMVLLLHDTRVSDLAPLAGLTGLHWLELFNTQVINLAPLAGLTGLHQLLLNSTQVLDLRPLQGLRRLVTAPDLGGLSFRGIPATADPRIAKIAEIEDDKARATALFALLDSGWVPPMPVEPVPLEPDPLLRSIVVDGKLEIEADPPTEEERRDRVKAVLHERLREKSSALSALAGNRFPRLANRARALSGLLDKPFEDLDLLSVHLEIEDLEDRRETGTEDGEPFPDEVRQAVSDVTRAGPGLTVGHPDVDLLLERRRLAREEVVPVAEDAAHRRLSRAVIDDPDANGPNSRAMEELLQRVADEATSRVLLAAKHRNLIWQITVLASSVTVGLGSNVAANLIAGAYGADITAFVTTNWTLLSEVAATYGRGVLVWFQQNVGPLVAGVDATAIRPVRKQDWPTLSGSDDQPDRTE